MTDHATPKAITRIEISEETSNDSELSELIKAISGETATDHALRKNDQAKFDRVMAELYVTDDGMKGSRIILPPNLQHRAVKTAHEGPTHDKSNRKIQEIFEKNFFFKYKLSQLKLP